jgi:hypothetical protein
MLASTTTRSGVFQRLAQPGPRLGHRWELLWTDVIGATNIACAAKVAWREVAAATADGGQ